jgi:hypothetical protein
MHTHTHTHIHTHTHTHQVAAEVANLASGLALMGAKPGTKIGVFGGNCPEWMEAMQVGGGSMVGGAGGRRERQEGEIRVRCSIHVKTSYSHYA